MKQIVLLAVAFVVGAAEAKISVYKNADILVKTLGNSVVQKFLETEFKIRGDAATLSQGELEEAKLEVVQSSGATKTYVQKLQYSVKGESGKSYLCTVTVNTTYEVINSGGGIESSKLSEPEPNSKVACR